MIEFAAPPILNLHFFLSGLATGLPHYMRAGSPSCALRYPVTAMKEQSNRILGKLLSLIWNI
jgi:hypothetical protein